MADGSLQERTEAPTPKRREDARRRGELPRSAEVTTAMLLLAGAGVAHMGSASLASAVRTLFGGSTQVAALPPGDLESAAGWVRTVGWEMLAALGPVLAVVAGASLLVGAVQARGVFTMHPLQPNWSRISPLRNVRRIVGVRSIAELSKSLFKLAIVAAVVFGSLSLAWTDLLTLGQQAPLALAEVMRRASVRLLAAAGSAYLLLALADYLYQVWQHERNLRMTREELKQEQKEMEGDLMVRARLRSMGRSLARRRMFREVPTSDVVITNPTHIAVALKYDPTRAPAPVVTAMGQRKIAERIKAIALEHGVPVVEDRPLARALLATARVGFPIPAELYVAVAEILAFVIRRRASGLGWDGVVVR